MLNKKTANFKVIAFIQARMGSRRLVKKALADISGKTMVENIFFRLKAAKELDDIILVTSDTAENDILAVHAKNIGLKCFRGSEEDLLERFYKASVKFKANAIIRITGDCPLVDPLLVDKMARIYRKNYDKFDLFTNVFPPSFPQGLDIEVLPFSVLEKLYHEVKGSFYRECFFAYIMENKDKFRIYNLKSDVSFLSMRWTVDYPEDLKFIREIFKALGNKIFSFKEVLKFLKKNPEISKINENRVDKEVIRGIRNKEYHSLINKKI